MTKVINIIATILAALGATALSGEVAGVLDLASDTPGRIFYLVTIIAAAVMGNLRKRDADADPTTVGLLLVGPLVGLLAVGCGGGALAEVDLDPVPTLDPDSRATVAASPEGGVELGVYGGGEWLTAEWDLVIELRAATSGGASDGLDAAFYLTVPRVIGDYLPVPESWFDWALRARLDWVFMQREPLICIGVGQRSHMLSGFPAVSEVCNEVPVEVGAGVRDVRQLGGNPPEGV